MVSNKLGHGSMHRPRWDGPDWSSNNHIPKKTPGFEVQVSPKKGTAPLKSSKIHHEMKATYNYTM